MHAADQGHGAATVALLELGADPTLQNETLNTAIDMAWDLEVCTIRLLSGQTVAVLIRASDLGYACLMRPKMIEPAVRARYGERSGLASKRPKPWRHRPRLSR